MSADPGAIAIAPPDGYQFGDDHMFTQADADRLSARLGKLIEEAKMATSQPLTFDQIRVGMRLRRLDDSGQGVVIFLDAEDPIIPGFVVLYDDDHGNPQACFPDEASEFAEVPAS